MSEKTDKYINEIPFSETCDSYCNYIEGLKNKANDRCLAVLEELELENEILKKENMGLKKVLSEIAQENKEYRDMVGRLRTTIEKYERSLD